MEQLVSSPWFIAGEVAGSSPALATNICSDAHIKRKTFTQCSVYVTVIGYIDTITTTMKNRGATPQCFNRVLEGKKDA